MNSNISKIMEIKKEFLLPNNIYEEGELLNVLSDCTEEQEKTIANFPFRKPKTVLILSVLLGSLGVDRFYLGDIAKGILKYITFGGLGIWWVIDILNAKKRCRDYNCKKLIASINDPAIATKIQQNDEAINKVIKTAKAAAPVVKAAKDGLKDIQDTFYVN